MLVTIYEFEQNLSRGVGGVSHTKVPPFMLYSKNNDKVP